jgi:hypothetical protein
MASGTKGRSRLGHQHAPLLLVATSLAGLAAVLWAAPAWAGAVKDEPGAIQQCSYTTGSNGSQLQWLPYRPSNVQPADGVQHADGKTVLAQHITPIAAPATVPSANDAFADPFGDGKKNYVPVIPARPIESSASGNEQTIGSDGLPQFPDGMPAARSGPARVISRPVPEVIAAPQGMLRKIPVQVEIPPELERPGPKSRYKPERKIESDQQELASIREELQGKCQTPQELVSQRPLTKISNDIRATTGDFPHECGLGLETYAPRNWSPTTYTWKAAATCHKPLYFEQVAPERYGHTWGPILEPIIEGAHFFVTIPLLPYEMGVEPPGECIYSLGYYRPGDCAPFMLDPFPLSIRGALFEGAAVTGAVLLVP